MVDQCNELDAIQYFYLIDTGLSCCFSLSFFCQCYIAPMQHSVWHLNIPLGVAFMDPFGSQEVDGGSMVNGK